MSDIQEEQKRLYKIAEENDIKLLQEENKKLKELCDKYEEEHSTTFQIWKYNKDTYKSRCEKAIDKLYCYGEVFDGKILQQFQKEMLDTLQGVDKE